MITVRRVMNDYEYAELTLDKAPTDPTATAEVLAFEKIVATLKAGTVPAGNTAAPNPKPQEQKPAEQPAQQQTKYEMPVPACNFCGSKVWDNRKDKKGPKSPDYKCKDATCGGAGWIQKDLSVVWKAGK